jgi:hypothetical protein
MAGFTVVGLAHLNGQNCQNCPVCLCELVAQFNRPQSAGVTSHLFVFHFFSLLFFIVAYLFFVTDFVLEVSSLLEQKQHRPQ